MNIGDRGPAPSFYDPPAPLPMVECEPCEGHGRTCGKDGNGPKCWTPFAILSKVEIRSEFCDAEHQCKNCKGAGEIVYRREEWLDI